MLPIEQHDTIIGQYAKSSDGKKPAFKDEEDVPDDSRCVTFCAAVGRIENERWGGVPFLLKAGKGTLEYNCRYLNRLVLIANINIPSPQRIPHGNQSQSQTLHQRHDLQRQLPHQ